MAGNTRGRLKERFEGVHRNFDWAIEHCNQSIILIENLPKPLPESGKKLLESIKGLGDGIKTLDELAQNIYAKL
jgi:hypothetical protein